MRLKIRYQQLANVNTIGFIVGSNTVVIDMIINNDSDAVDQF